MWYLSIRTAYFYFLLILYSSISYTLSNMFQNAQYSDILALDNKSIC